MYKEHLEKLIIKGIIGFVIGFFFAYLNSPEFGFGGFCLIGIFFAGLPYGWELSGKIIGSWIISGDFAILIVTFLLRIIFSILIGGVSYPIALIYYIIRVHKESY